MSALEATEISKRFGGFVALDNVSLSIASGSIVGLIGPNGSGKSTLINVMTGVLPADGGEVQLDGESVDLSRPDRAARAGIARVFQTPRVARRLTAIQNVLLAGPDQPGESLVQLVVGRSAVRKREGMLRDEAFELLDKLGLAHEANSLAGSLSGGQLKLLSMCMLLMRRPKVILLDEPAAGVNPVLVERINRLLVDLRGDGLAVLVVEHNMQVIHDICDTVVVLAAGRVVARGTPAEVAQDKAVVSAFLGIGTAA